METMLHQLILTIPDLADIHPKSKAWLDDNTVLKTRGLTLLQASRLSPEEKKRMVEAEEKIKQTEEINRRSINLQPVFKPEND
jgi:hypothetical protein